MEQDDCEKVLATTRQMTAALQKEDLEQLGAALDQRQECLDRLSRPTARITPEGRHLLTRAAELDEKVQAAARKLRARYHKALFRQQEKAKGLFQYQYSQLNATQGQWLDKKR